MRFLFLIFFFAFALLSGMLFFGHQLDGCLIFFLASVLSLFAAGILDQINSLFIESKKSNETLKEIELHLSHVGASVKELVKQGNPVLKLPSIPGKEAYYVYDNTKIIGPILLDEICEQIQSLKLDENCLYYCEKEGRWDVLKNILRH